ncbi:MAG: transposon-encoded TnpW family protein [Deltaproteobacteria bacterium]|nr:transposon-encoded TnpW family protein [Deltaproteobacteria bacterium]
MRIDKTTYIVFVHFSKTSTETIEDKIMRLLQYEAQEKDAPRTD